MAPEESFDRFVAAHGSRLWRLAWLLTGDGHRAEALVESALSRVLTRWQAIDAQGGSHEAAVRREIVAVQVSGRRGASGRTERVDHPSAVPGAPVADVLAPAAGGTEERRRELLAVLGTLEPVARAAVVFGYSSDVPEWDAADALDRSTAELAALVADATAAARLTSPRADDLLAGMNGLVPEPDHDPGRAARVRRRTAASRRSRLVRSAVGCAVLVAIVAVPVALSDADTDASLDTGEPPPAVVAARLVDPLPIPDSCTRLPDVPDEPDLDYEPAGAAAMWMRFCPARDAEGLLGALDFAPDETVVSQELDGLVDDWATPSDAPPVCGYSAFAYQGLVRAQVGTLDGALHVVDMRVGECGSVYLDGVITGAEGRTAFLQAVRLLATEKLEEIDGPGVVPPRALACPAAVHRMGDLDRTTIPDYPRTDGLSMTLPATSALVCRYSPPAADGGAPVIAGRLLDATYAERLRAAYLTRSVPARGGSCTPETVATTYGVVLSDPTGSRRSFTVGHGGCARVKGPGGERGTAGPWLSELLRAVPVNPIE